MYLKIDKGKPKDVNMYSVGLGNTRISIGYAHKISRVTGWETSTRKRCKIYNSYCGHSTPQSSLAVGPFRKCLIRLVTGNQTKQRLFFQVSELEEVKVKNSPSI